MKKLHNLLVYALFLIATLLFNGVLLAQVDPEDPFEGNYRISHTAQILLMKVDSADLSISGSLHTASENLEANGLLHGPETNANAPGLLDEYAQFDVASGDFDDNGLEEFVAAWESPNNFIQLLVSSINIADNSWTEVARRTAQQDNLQKGFNLSGNPENYFIRNPIRVISGQFDLDADDELILAYWAANGAIQLAMYDLNSGLQPILKDSIADSYMNPDLGNLSSDGSRSCKFDIGSGDFDGDGNDEIILVYVEPDGTDWKSYVKIYKYSEENGQLVSTLKKEIDLTNFTTNVLLYRLAVAAGNFDGDSLDEAVLSWQLLDPGEPSCDLYIQTLQISKGLDTLLTIDQPEGFTGSNGSSGWPLSLISGDIDYDNKDEIFVAARNTLRVYKTKENLGIGSAIAFLDIAVEEDDVFNRTLVLSDINAAEDEPLSKELVIAEKVSDGVHLRFYNDTNKSDSSFSGLQLAAELTDSGTVQLFAVSALNKDGLPLTLGTPKRQTRTDITQPLVILNAPPLHFDIFNSVQYDINGCYGGEGCSNRSVYVNATTVETEVSTEVSSDWAVSTSLSGGGGFSYKGLLSAGVNSTLNRRYGRGFSRVEGSIETYQVTVSSDAIDDDRIFATIANYEILEYPVYAKDELVGHVVAVVPQVHGVTSLQNTWLGSKSGKLRTYPTQHEVGNILSYKALAELPDGAALFGNGSFTSGGGNTWEMSPSASQTWELAFNSSEIAERQRRSYEQVSRTLSGDVSGGFGPFNVNFSASVTDDYSSSRISTHKINIKQESALRVEFGPVDGSILGTKTYTVSPFVYWAESGALVLDYAVQPDISPGVASWWEENYSALPDPAMILPWRYDEEKGNGGPNPELQKQETREILFDPLDPRPDELTTIWLRIHNYSLLDFSGNGEVQFYLGDPSNGGQLITNEQGISKVEFTSIPSRESIIVSLENWLVPDNITNETKIYVLIDPEGKIDEIHENNNKGWTILNPDFSTSTAIDPSPRKVIPAEFKVAQNYPNPFNPKTTIEFTLAKQETVLLEIFNNMGARVAILRNGLFNAGSYKITWDGTNLNGTKAASGLYYYRLMAGKNVVIKKMILIK